MLRLVQSEERVLLLHGNALNGAAARKYIELGVDGRIDLRFKCRVRTPWYSIPGVTIPDAFLTYMSSDQGPRLSLNIARATCSNTLLAVRLPGVPKNLFRTFAWGFYNSATLLSAETVGRPYGGGVLKLEPSEADRLLVPSPSLLRKAAADSSLLKTVDNLVRSGRRKEAESLVDSVLLVEHAGLTRREQGVIRTALASCQQRR